MAQQTNVFVATVDELRSCFPDFRAARTEPVVREGRNPRTGEVLRVQNWDVGSDVTPASFSDNQGRINAASVLSLEPGHEQHIAGVSPLARTFPHYPFFNLSFSSLGYSLVGSDDHPDYFFRCADPEEYVEVLSRSATALLADSTPEEWSTIVTHVYPNGTSYSDADVLVAKLLHQIAKIAINSDSLVCLHGSL